VSRIGGQPGLLSVSDSRGEITFNKRGIDMAIIGERQFLERLQFFNGQRLSAPDLQALEVLNRELRWLHNQSLHQPGIGSGYAVVGQKGDREVTIAPGYAIDALGREIVLTTTRVEPVPPVAHDGTGRPIFYHLTVSYPDDSELEETETRDGICLPRGVVRLREEPVFCWVRLNELLQPQDEGLKAHIQNGLKILVAQAEVFNCQLHQSLSIEQRRNARPAMQPYIACGKTNPTSTDWRLLPGDEESNIGLQVTVDTSAARFRTPPCYSAQIVGTRVFSMEDSPPMQFLLDGFVHTSQPTATSFTLRVLMPEMQVGNLPINPSAFFLEEFFTSEGRASLQENGWHVAWMGVEG
jgi:hypothetical protein